MSLKANLFKNIFFGFECEISSLMENFIREYILTNLNPELVEKNDPPTIINNKNINANFCGVFSSEIPTFETLLEMAKKR